MNLSRVKYDDDGNPYVLYFCRRKDGRIAKDYHYGEIRNCSECGNKYFADNKSIEKRRGLYCSCKCSNKLKNNPSWRGGVIVNQGYIFKSSPNHPFRNNWGLGYVPEHRLEIEKRLGRYLKNTEFVHHKNKNTFDNRITNLMVINNYGAHRNFDKTGKIKQEYIVFNGDNDA